MFLQAVPPPIPPPPPPGLPLENEIILLIFGILYGVIVLSRRKVNIKKSLAPVKNTIVVLRVYIQIQNEAIRRTKLAAYRK